MTATANFDLSRTQRSPQLPALTRRGRVLLLGIPAMILAATLLAAIVFAGAALFNQAQAATGAPAGLEAEVITVTEGDTLWSIASASQSSTDVQLLISQIAELNDLDSSQLAPGQELYLPVD